MTMTTLKTIAEGLAFAITFLGLIGLAVVL